MTRFPGPPVLDAGARRIVARWATSHPDPLAGMASVPTRFALPSPEGFSADTAHGLPRVDYRISEPHTDKAFLPANADGSRLGAVPRTARTPVRNTLELPAPAPLAPASGIAAARGLVEIQGPAALGTARHEIVVSAWAETSSPQPVRIEFAVNPSGEVITARVVLSSGSRTGDATALAAVRDARFEPRANPVSGELLHPGSLLWAVAMIHPAAAPSTNPPAAAPVTR
jgi:TonB family protein